MTLTQSDLDQIRGIVKQEVTVVRDELFELINQLAIHTQQQIDELRAEMQAGFLDLQLQINDIHNDTKLIWGELADIKRQLHKIEIRIIRIEGYVSRLDQRTTEDDQANFKEIDRLNKRVTKLEKRHILLHDQIKALKHPTVK